MSDRTEIEELFKRTNVRELQRLFSTLGSFYHALWQLFHNGHKPVLRPRRYSVRQIRAFPSPAIGNTEIQEKIIHETEKFLLAAADRAEHPDVVMK